MAVAESAGLVRAISWGRVWRGRTRRGAESRGRDLHRYLFATDCDSGCRHAAPRSAV